MTAVLLLSVTVSGRGTLDLVQLTDRSEDNAKSTVPLFILRLFGVGGGGAMYIRAVFYQNGTLVINDCVN